MSSGVGEGGHDPGEILGSLWALLQVVLDDSEPALEALGLSAKAFFVLEAVEAHPFPAEIARKMHLPPPTVTYLIKQLEAKGFLERKAEPGDLRKFRLVRTEVGTAAVRRGCEDLGATFGVRLRWLDRDEVAAFDRIVRRLASGRDDGA